MQWVGISRIECCEAMSHFNHVEFKDKTDRSAVSRQLAGRLLPMAELDFAVMTEEWADAQCLPAAADVRWRVGIDRSMPGLYQQSSRRRTICTHSALAIGTYHSIFSHILLLSHLFHCVGFAVMARSPTAPDAEQARFPCC